MNTHLASQLNSLLAALILLTAFALVVQRRMNALLHIFAWQGFLLAVSTAIVGFLGGVHHLYISSILTLSVKVILLPYILHLLILKLKIHKEVDSLINIPTTMLIGIVLVIYSYHLTKYRPWSRVRPSPWPWPHSCSGSS
jgi:hydrogenase-4 component E